MRKLILAAASIAALALAGPAAAQSPIVIKFSHVVATNTPKGLAAEKFKELAEKYTDGKVKVEIYPNSQLYKDKEELEALQLGAVQMLAPSNAKFGPIGVKEFEVFDLPYILPDLEDTAQSYRGAARRKAAEAARLQGNDRARLLGQRLQDDERQQEAAHARRLQGPQVPHPVLQGAGSADALAGRDPAGDGVLRSLSGLQTGVVDGQENSWSNIYTQKMHEVQKYITDTNHGYIGYVVVVNKKFWDGIPADIRGQLEKAMKEATAYGNGQSQKENDDALAEIKKSGKTEIVKLTPEQDAAMRKAMEAVYKDVAGRVGQPLDRRVPQGNKGRDQLRRRLIGLPCHGAEALAFVRGRAALAAKGMRKVEPDFVRDRMIGMGELMLLRILDRLEELLITFLIAAATLIIFVAVAASLSGRHSLVLSAAVSDQPVVGAGALHLHVRVDGEVRRRLWRAHRHSCRRRRAREQARSALAQGDGSVRPVMRRAVYGGGRDNGRKIRLRADTTPIR